MPKRIIIAALSRDHIIGTQDGMPWNVPEEYAQYLDFVRGQSVIMGRKTFEIFREDLSSKRAFVVSRQLDAGPGYEVCEGLDQALARAQTFPETIFVAGGASIYAQALDKVDQLYLSYIKGDFDGIAYFPEFDQSLWEIIKQEDHPRFQFVVYQRKGYQD